MKFDIAAINYRSDFPRKGSVTDVCGVLNYLFRFAVNTLVLTAVLAWIDFYFSKAALPSMHELVMQNLKVALIGLIAIRVAYPVAFAAGIVVWAVSKSDAYRYLGIFALLLSGGVIVIVKYHFISKFGLVFTYPLAIALSEAFIVLSLRSYVESYGVRCRDIKA